MNVGDVLEPWCDEPFRYGRDCCTFAGEIVEFFKGRNPMQRFQYQSMREATKLISSFGDLEAAITDTLGPPIDSTHAENGDAALVEFESGRQVAGAIINGRVVVRTEKGICDLPLIAAKHIWRT